MQATHKIYAREGTRFFSELPATFKHLVMDTTIFPNVLELLSQAKLTLTTLELTDEAHPLYVFKEPKQFEYIHVALPNIRDLLVTVWGKVNQNIQLKPREDGLFDEIPPPREVYTVSSLKQNKVSKEPSFMYKSMVL
jgi:hypothetical protein